MGAFRRVLLVAAGSLSFIVGMTDLGAARAGALEDHRQEFARLTKARQYLRALPQAMIVRRMSEVAARHRSAQTAKAALDLAITYDRLGWLDQADTSFADAYAIGTSALEQTDADRMEITGKAADFYLEVGDYKRAASLSRELLGELKVAAAPKQKLVPSSIRYAMSQRFSDAKLAVQLLKEALAYAQATYSKDDSRIGTVLLALGQVYLAQRNLGKALNYYYKVIGDFSGGQAHPSALGHMASQDLAFLYYLKGRYQKMIDTLHNGGANEYRYNGRRQYIGELLHCPAGLTQEQAANGWVYVGYDVDDTGRVINPQVLAANPPILFDRISSGYCVVGG